VVVGPLSLRVVAKVSIQLSRPKPLPLRPRPSYRPKSRGQGHKNWPRLNETSLVSSPNPDLDSSPPCSLRAQQIVIIHASDDVSLMFIIGNFVWTITVNSGPIVYHYNGTRAVLRPAYRSVDWIGLWSCLIGLTLYLLPSTSSIFGLHGVTYRVRHKKQPPKKNWITQKRCN